jgi:hypothetical protein
MLISERLINGFPGRETIAVQGIAVTKRSKAAI